MNRAVLTTEPVTSDGWRNAWRSLSSAKNYLSAHSREESRRTLDVRKSTARNLLYTDYKFLLACESVSESISIPADSTLVLQTLSACVSALMRMYMYVQCLGYI